MKHFMRAALLSTALAVLFATPAHAATLKGQVIGTPYVADSARTAVPVLFSKESAKKAKLKSPLGLVIVPRRKSIPAPGGAVLPARLRLGDRFTASAPVGKDAKSAAYPRVTLKQVSVIKRAKQLSNAELEELLTQTRKEVARLTQTVTGLGTTVQQALQAVDAKILGLGTAVSGLVANLDGVKTTVGALTGSLAAAAADLRSRIDLVRADLQPQVTALLGDVTSLTIAVGSCATPLSVLGRICAMETAFGALDLLDVPGLITRVTNLSGALTGVVNLLGGLNLTGDLPAALTGQITTALGQLAGLQGTVSGLTSSVGGLTSTVGGLTSNIGAVNVGTLSTTLGNLLGALGANPAGFSPTAITDLQTLLATAQGNIATLTGLVGGVNVGALSTTVGNLTSSIGTINGTLTGICSAVNGQTLPVLGSLPLVGSITGLLTAQLTDACP